MISLSLPYVKQIERTRGTAYRYRRQVPPALRERIGRKNWLKSWRPGTPFVVVEREARRLCAQHDREIARAQGNDLSAEDIADAEDRAREVLKEDLEDIHATKELFLGGRDQLSGWNRAFINAIDNKGRYLPDTMALSAAFDRDVRLYGKDRDLRPPTHALASFVDVIGDKDVATINRMDVADWIQAMAGQLKPATTRRYVGCLSAMVNRLFRDLDVDRRNPFQQHHIPDSQGSATDRLPFNREMLARINSYLANSKRLGHVTRNIIVLLKYTGATPGEIGGLALSDIALDAEIPYLWIRPNAFRRIKNDFRDRQVPLVGDAFMAAKDAVIRAHGRLNGLPPEHVALFEGFGSGVKAGDSISAKLNLAIRRSGVPKSDKLVAYSFRHTMKEALRMAEVPDNIQRRLQGHSGHGVADRYGSPRVRLAESRKALVLAIEHLGDVDPAIYSEAERC